MVDLIGVPFDLCGRRQGSRLGPAALRLAGLAEALAEMGLDVCDLGDVMIRVFGEPEDGLRSFASAQDAYTSLRDKVEASARAGRMPMVLGGDHSLAIGSIAGALKVWGERLAILWIDAHVDINTPGTSPSGNLHGMPVAALMGFPSGKSGTVDEQWRILTERVVGSPYVAAGRFGWIGLRDVDRGERAALQGLPESYATTMQDIDRFGVQRVVNGFDAWMRQNGATHLWISFDVDALDPILAPGTGTAVRGGLTYREAHLSAELLREHLDQPGCPYQLVGLDLVETNPLYDSHNETARLAVEWIASLFGKSILGVPSRLEL